MNRNYKNYKNKEIKVNEKVLPEPLIANCFQCQSKVIVKWNKPLNKYSEKSNLGYYSERAEDKEKYFCEKCIFKLYYQNKTKYWQLVPNLKKRQVLRSYIYLNTLKIKG